MVISLYTSTATYKLPYTWLFLSGTPNHWIALLSFGQMLTLGDMGGISVLLENTWSLNSSIRAQTTPFDRPVAQSCSRWGFLELEKGSGEGQGWPGPWAAEQRDWMTASGLRRNGGQRGRNKPEQREEKRARGYATRRRKWGYRGRQTTASPWAGSDGSANGSSV